MMRPGPGALLAAPSLAMDRLHAAGGGDGAGLCPPGRGHDSDTREELIRGAD